MASMFPRRLLGLAAVAIGLGLAFGAQFALREAEVDPAGDFERVEADLQVAPQEERAADDAVLPERPPGPVDGPAQPRWQPNPERPLGERRQPVRLIIDVIGVSAPVIPTGVDQTGQMEMLDNVGEVAWYEHGPAPGEPGSAVLAAHVDLYGEGPGAFFRLRELEPGDVVRVSRDDATELVFAVEARVEYPKSSLPVDVLFSDRGPATLTLVTCGGSFDPSTSRYDSNVVVYARLLAEPATFAGLRAAR